MSTATATPTLMTAREYAQLPATPFPTELVKGRVIEMPVPTPRHGQLCYKIARFVGGHVDDHNLGHVVLNDSGIITQRNPDTVRGADAAFYSFARVPRGPIPTGYLEVLPELVFEVRSPSDQWGVVLQKASEYINACVSVLCVLDPGVESMVVFDKAFFPRTLHGEDEFHLPELLGELRVPVRRFFE